MRLSPGTPAVQAFLLLPLLALSTVAEAKTLTLTAGSLGSYVTSEPAGLDCGTWVANGVVGPQMYHHNCEGSFPVGTVVRLRPNFSAEFPTLSAWPGCPDFRENSHCVLTITNDMTLPLPIYVPAAASSTVLKVFPIAGSTATSWTNDTTCPTDTYTVPANVYFLSVQVRGGNGKTPPPRSDIAGGTGGYGANLSAIVPVLPGQKLSIVAGEHGTTAIYQVNSAFSGGGRAYDWTGGGFSFISRGDTTGSGNSCLPSNANDLLMLAGGGGAGGYAGNIGTGGNGGNGGLWPDGTGGAGQRSGGINPGGGGGGGTMTAGGANGTNPAGTARNAAYAFQGGSCEVSGDTGGAGGGGFYGGGCGGNGYTVYALSGGGGGGGGSSYIAPSAGHIAVSSNNGGPTPGVTVQPAMYSK